MGENSKITWTDHTFNPWMGCTKVHEGCRHCYAEDLMDNRYGKAKWGSTGTRVMTAPANWKQPLKWDKQAAADGVRRKVFCASLADIFEDWQGLIHDHQGNELCVFGNVGEFKSRAFGGPEHSPVRMDHLRRRLFEMIDATPNLDWLLLTKRPENIRRMWVSRVELQTDLNEIDHRPNVWLLTSVSEQPTADKMIPELLKCRDLVPVLGVSAEPLLGPLTFRWAKWQPLARNPGESVGHLDGIRSLDWVIVGAESGFERRPMQDKWAVDLSAQCHEAGAAFFMKQMEVRGKVSDTLSDFPGYLQIQQYPQPTT